jgi:hypothetical protein
MSSRIRRRFARHACEALEGRSLLSAGWGVSAPATPAEFYPPVPIFPPTPIHPPTPIYPPEPVFPPVPI